MTALEKDGRDISSEFLPPPAVPSLFGFKQKKNPITDEEEDDEEAEGDENDDDDDLPSSDEGPSRSKRRRHEPTEGEAQAEDDGASSTRHGSVGLGSASSTSSPGSTEAPSSSLSQDEDDDDENHDHDDDGNDRTSADYYFDSYSHHAIHEEMLKDEVRTRTYEMAIKQNAHVFRNKIVLDVGCGTGILSMFAAQAGAKHVYGVDMSSIANQARDIVQLNGFSDTVTIIRGKVEDIELPVSKVDVIVSEWMGYFLLYESMLDTVLYARDKWLVDDGVIFPDKAVMYIGGLEDGDVKRDRIDFWTNVYGFDMSPLKEIAIKEPVVDVVASKAIVTDCVPILHLDILTCTKEDLQFKSSFNLTASRNDYLHGLVAYFECAFTQVHKPIGFSTSPFCRYTHWKQTLFYLQNSLTICKGETISGKIACKPNKRNPRDLDIALSVSFRGQYCTVEEQMKYRLR